MQLTVYQAFKQKWAGGCGAEECTAPNTRQCWCRGTIPADILFVGEAPGFSENVLGQPFVGPAGQLLDKIISRSVPPEVTCCFTNLVACIPRQEDGSKVSEPSDEQVRCCAERLVEFVEIVYPKLVVCVGAVARDWLNPQWKDSIELPGSPPRIDIKHPAAILRDNIANRGLAIQRCEVVIRNAINDYVLGNAVQSYRPKPERPNPAKRTTP